MEILQKDSKVAPFVKEILLLENSSDELHKLPFFADGYPGIIFSETAEAILLLPINKLLPDFFLYGQTIEPIELQIKGAYKLIVFQLYPFATRLLLGINPKEINDDCYDLKQVEGVDTEATLSVLRERDTNQQLEAISEYVVSLVKISSANPDNLIKLAVSTILNLKGVILIKDLRDQLHVSERTFERRFKKEIGVTPKQFAKIVQFSFSLNQIQESDYSKFINVAYENGFADQSHFIKTFKKYTGATPKELLLKLI